MGQSQSHFLFDSQVCRAFHQNIIKKNKSMLRNKNETDAGIYFYQALNGYYGKNAIHHLTFTRQSFGYQSMRCDNFAAF